LHCVCFGALPMRKTPLLSPTNALQRPMTKHCCIHLRCIGSSRPTISALPTHPGRVERKNGYFKKDPLLPAYTNLKSYYLNNPHGYERGHNMNAADNSCDLEQMKECHYFSNITPQTVALNEHVWGDLEDYTRRLVLQFGRVEVWCGSYGFKEKMGPVSVPLFCWKIIRYANTVEAYIMPNDTVVDRKPYTYYKTTVSSIRTASHLPLPGLPNI
jgi:DNA/RNA endonuclease G (NUC1)